MDYKEQIELLHNLEAIAYGYNINGEVFGIDCSDFEQIMVDTAHSIEELLARAEAAEADNERLREAMKPNCILCDSMHESGNCTEVGGFCTAVPAAHCPMIPRLRDRAEAAEAAQATLQRAMVEYKDRAEKAENIASDLLDDFTDFVTGGVPNASPYCANRRPDCVDVRGWCKGDSKVCKGFLPRAAIEKEE